MKWAGICLISVAIAAFGLQKSARLSRRAAILERLERLCLRVGEELRLTGGAPAELLSAPVMREEVRALPFLAVCSSVSAEQFHACWRRESTVFARKNGLSEDEAALLCEFGLALGTTDLYGQRQLCTRFASRFSERREAAAREVAEKGRLYASLGGIGGLATALILI